MTSEKELIATSIARALETAQELAVTHQTCKRKAVGCAVVEIGYRPCQTAKRSPPLLYVKPLFTKINGPLPGHECSNVVGNCGCVHAEQRAVISLMLARSHNPCPGLLEPKTTVLVCQYSPCTSCANLIVACEEITDVVYAIPTEHDLRGIDILRANIKSAQQIAEMSSEDLLAWVT